MRLADRNERWQEKGLYHTYLCIVFGTSGLVVHSLYTDI